MLRALGNNVIVRVDDGAREQSGIIVEAIDTEEGEVVSVPQMVTDLEAGDIVVFPKAKRLKMIYDNEVYYSIQYHTILSIKD